MKPNHTHINKDISPKLLFLFLLLFGVSAFGQRPSGRRNGGAPAIEDLIPQKLIRDTIYYDQNKTKTDSLCLVIEAEATIMTLSDTIGIKLKVYYIDLKYSDSLGRVRKTRYTDTHYIGGELVGYFWDNYYFNDTALVKVVRGVILDETFNNNRNFSNAEIKSIEARLKNVQHFYYSPSDNGLTTDQILALCKSNPEYTIFFVQLLRGKGFIDRQIKKY
jgi:hypothetical protein